MKIGQLKSSDVIDHNIGVVFDKESLSVKMVCKEEKGMDTVRQIIQKWYVELKIPEQYDNDFLEYLRRTEISSDITVEEYPEKDGEENLLSCLYFCEQLKEQYEKKGIEREILYDTLQELYFWIRSCSERSGKLWLENLGWVKLHLTMKLFRLGRLNFCMGQQPFDLPKWNLAKGSPIIEVHIPRGDTLRQEDCQRSFQQAKSFFDMYFPEFQYQYFTCFSWLLDSKLIELLPPDSNIMKFQKLFKVVKEEKSEETLHYVFGKGTTNQNVVEKECRSSLAAKIRERVLKGETFHESYGIVERQNMYIGVL